MSGEGAVNTAVQHRLLSLGAHTHQATSEKCASAGKRRHNGAFVMTSRPFRLAQLTDLHWLADPAGRVYGVDTRSTGLEVLEAVKAWQPDALLLTGDLADRGEEAAYRDLAEAIGALPCYALPGNHDEPQRMARHLTVPDGPSPLGGWQLLPIDAWIADSEAGRLGPARLEALRRALDEINSPTLAASHHPPLSVGSAWADESGLLDGAAVLAALGGQPQVRALVCGHVHQALGAWHGNVRVLTSPSTGSQARPRRAQFEEDTRGPGYRRLWLYPDGRWSTQVYRISQKQ